jgi:predicted nucleic acid-binding protein
VQRRLQDDWDRFAVVPVDAACLSLAGELGCEHRVRTLDAIHLAAAMRLPGPVTFLSFDRQQAEAAGRLGLHVPHSGD